MDDATPVEQLTELMGQSTAALGASMAGALALIEPGHVSATGTHIRWR
jgi:hypothetical protein